MRYPAGFELPPEQQDAMSKAKRLEWISLAYWTTAIIALYFTLGQSQAMKAALLEDLLALFPPIAFLVAARFRDRPPSARFPWGYHRSISVAYLVATVALFGLGSYVVVDSAATLIQGHHPPIGMVEVLDLQVWAGWLMLAALLYSGLPPLLLGRMKMRLADSLHDKVLHADALMNRADWMTAGAAMAGVVGIGLGIWFADAVAAIVIGADIVRDGFRYMRESVSDLMDERAHSYDESEPHPLIDRVREESLAAGGVRAVAARLREHGHVLGGDVWLLADAGEEPVSLAGRVAERLDELDWRLHDLHVSVIDSLDSFPDEIVLRAET